MNRNQKNHSDLDQKANELGIGGFSTSEVEESSYRLRMQKRKEVQQKRLEKRDKEKGLLIIFTGNGKGKTTAALGMGLRMLGHKEKVAIIQFIKGGWTPGEEKAFRNFTPEISWHSLGEGFTWETQDRSRDKELVTEAWTKALDYLKKEEYKLVILDEINIAIKLGYISESEVINGTKSRPPMTHVVLTGRGATEELINNADLATEMKLLRHPFKEQGIKAQKGIEY